MSSEHKTYNTMTELFLVKVSEVQSSNLFFSLKLSTICYFSLSFSAFTNNHICFGLHWCKSKARLKDNFNHELLLWETATKEEQWEMNCKCYCQVQTVNIGEVAGITPSSKHLLLSAVWYLDPFVAKFLMDKVKILIKILTFRPWIRVGHFLLLTTRYHWRLYSSAEVWVIT